MKKLGALFFGLLLFNNLYAADSVFAEYGSGCRSTMERIGAGWDWNRQWFDEGDWLLTGSWEATLGNWQGHSSPAQPQQAPNNKTVTDIGLAPVFRLQQKAPSDVAPYLEGAIGFHLVSPTSIYTGRNFSTAFQFGDHVGIGIRFGERHKLDLALRYQHLSNADLKMPNSGIDFGQVHFGYHF